MKIKFLAALFAALLSTASATQHFKVDAMQYKKKECRGGRLQGPYFVFKDEIKDGTCKSKNYRFRAAVLDKHQPDRVNEIDDSQFGICDVEFYEEQDCGGELVTVVPYVNGPEFPAGQCWDWDSDQQAMSMRVRCREADGE